jgi:hypothetical protein
MLKGMLMKKIILAIAAVALLPATAYAGTAGKAATSAATTAARNAAARAAAPVAKKINSAANAVAKATGTATTAPVAIPPVVQPATSSTTTVPATTPAATGKPLFSVADTPLGSLLDNPAAKAVLNKYIPAMIGNPQIDMARSMTLAQLQSYAGDALSNETLAKIGLDLAGIK